MSKNNSWTKTIDIDGEVLTYGFIDDGGHGDRYFVIVKGESLPLSISEEIVKLCETVTQLIKSESKETK